MLNISITVGERQMLVLVAYFCIINVYNMLSVLSEKLMVYLRDGRTLIGYLRSVDQFANLVLHRTIERIHVGTRYGDIERGVFVIRGENVVLLGEIVSFLSVLVLCACSVFPL